MKALIRSFLLASIFSLAGCATTAPVLVKEILEGGAPGIAAEVPPRISVDGPSQLAVLIYYPSRPASEEARRRMNDWLLARFSTGEPSYQAMLRQEDWASQWFVRSTYMALQAYQQIQRHFPEHHVALWPVTVGFDGQRFTLSEDVAGPGATVGVWVSAVSLPSAYRMYSCGTCGGRIRPFIAINSHTLNALSCSYTTPTPDHWGGTSVELYWPKMTTLDPSLKRTTVQQSDVFTGTFYLPNEARNGLLSGRAIVDRSCLGGAVFQTSTGQLEAKNFTAKNRSLDIAGNRVALIMLPQAATSWIHDSIAEPNASTFLGEDYATWGGYLDWVRDIALVAHKRTQTAMAQAPQVGQTNSNLVSLYFEGLSTFKLTDHFPYEMKPYGTWAIQPDEYTLGLVAQALDVERRFVAMKSEAWANEAYMGPFGESFRRMLAEEVAIERRAGSSMVSMMVTALATGAANAASGAPLDFGRLSTQAQSIVDSGSRGSAENQALLADTTAGMAIEFTTGNGQKKSIEANDLVELRTKLREVMLNARAIK